MSQNYESFGKYILLDKIATGGMAEVYLAKNVGASGINKFIAMKRILPQFSESTEFIDMFKDEAKIAVNLSHGNIVSIYEFGVERGQFFLVMDYVEGRNLRQILNKMKKSGLTFSVEQVLYIIKEVAAGLDHAHRCLDGSTGKPLNITHRDMSPQNVMISFEGEVKIVDFGIAKAETQIESTRAGTLKGKFGYMSPEQAEGQPVDLRTDIFSLGIVLWELLANDRLFIANNEINTLRKIRECQIPSLRKINPNIPPELERICGKALAKDRNLRYQTAAAFHRELNRFLNRQFPDFSPHDFSVFIKTLFASEILENRKKLVEFAKVELKAPEPEKPAPPRTDTFEVTATGSFTATTTDSDIGTEKSLAPSAPAKVQAQVKPAPAKAQKQPAAEPVKAEKPRREEERPAREPELRLSVDHGPNTWNSEHSQVREGTFTNSSYRSYSSYRSKTPTGTRPSSTMPTAILAVVLFGLVGAIVYVVANNPQFVANAVARWTKGPKPVATPIELASTQAMVDVVINSSPSGANVLVNDKGEGLTPAYVRVPANQPFKLTVKLSPEYKIWSEEVMPPEQNNGTVNVVLEKLKYGFLTVNVIGKGEIFIDDRRVTTMGPQKVLANQEVKVRAYDPVSGFSDETTVTVQENQPRSITLYPRKVPEPAQKNPGSQGKP